MLQLMLISHPNQFFFIVDKSYGRLVEASTTAVIPRKQGGIVSGKFKSP